MTRRTCATIAALGLLLQAGAARAAAKPELERGKLLVASDQLLDPNFRQTVVLLLEHDAPGALGVVVNRPTNVKLATLLPDVQELHDRADLVFLGGPVARDRMILLVRASEPPPESARVLDGVFITSSLDVLRTLSRDKEAGFRSYVGYAGWGPSQLEAEIERGDWRVTHADPSSLFDKDPSALWRELNERTSGQWVRVPRRDESAPLPEPVTIAARRVSARSAESPCLLPPGTPGARRRSP